MLPDGLRFDIKSVTSSDERVVVEAQGNGMTAGGKPYRNQYCFVFSFQDGKIANFHEYFCHVLADDVLWSLARASGKLDAEPVQ